MNKRSNCTVLSKTQILKPDGSLYQELEKKVTEKDFKVQDGLAVKISESVYAVFHDGFWEFYRTV